MWNLDEDAECFDEYVRTVYNCDDEDPRQGEDDQNCPACKSQTGTETGYRCSGRNLSQSKYKSESKVQCQGPGLGAQILTGDFTDKDKLS